MKTFNRTYLPEEITYNGKVYSKYNNAKGPNSIRVMVQTRSEKGKYPARAHYMNPITDDQLVEKYLDYVNNFATVERFAEYHGYSTQRANQVIEQGRKSHEAKVIPTAGEKKIFPSLNSDHKLVDIIKGMSQTDVQVLASTNQDKFTILVENQVNSKELFKCTILFMEAGKSTLDEMIAFTGYPRETCLLAFEYNRIMRPQPFDPSPLSQTFS